ncbi:MAG: HU family DNA-binding protein [Alphaproteobacteria bacterium]|nr:HU family DNA-binding protein [Alphaproteobacteria bacterium]
MKKADLIAKMAEKSGLTKDNASKALEAFISTVIQALHDKQEVQLVGFGSFYIGSRNAITARNPRTGEPIQIPATNFPKFKAGKLLKDAVN